MVDNTPENKRKIPDPEGGYQTPPVQKNPYRCNCTKQNTPKDNEVLKKLPKIEE